MTRRRGRRAHPPALAAAVLLLLGCRPEGTVEGTFEGTVRIGLASLAPDSVSGAGAYAPVVAPLGAGERELIAGSEIEAIEQRAGARAAWELAPGSAARLTFIPLGTSSAGGCGSRYRAGFRPAGAAEETVLFESPVEPQRRFAPAAVEIELPAAGGGPGPGAEPAPAAGRLTLAIVAAPGAPERCRRETALWGSPAVVATRRLPRRRPAELPNVLILGVDTLRADRVGPRGERPSLTPAIDRLLAESDVWTRAYTSFNSTNPSFASVFSGLAGRRHGVYDLSTPLPAHHTTLAERFREAGYRTLAVIAARHLAPQWSGLGQGFDEVLLPEGRQLAAERVVDLAIERLDRSAPRKHLARPFFAWLHLFDPHTPTRPPEPFASGMGAAAPAGLGPVASWRPFRDPGPRSFVERWLGGHPDLYDGEVAYLDRQVDRLLGFLEEQDLLEETLVVFFADHGESLGEHGVLHSHAGLTEPIVRVPLALRWPESFRERRPGAPDASAGRRFDGLVQTIDLHPTLLAAAGLRVPAGLDARNLYGLGPAGRRAVFVEHANHGGAALRTARYKYVRLTAESGLPPGVDLFDLEADPGETEDLAGRGLSAEERLATALAGWLAEGRAAAPSVELTDEDRERLRALGYLR